MDKIDNKQQRELDKHSIIGVGEHVNKISAGDFYVYSSTESLDMVAKCLDNIITKHKEYIEWRVKVNSIRSMGGVG